MCTPSLYPPDFVGGTVPDAFCRKLRTGFVCQSVPTVAKLSLFRLREIPSSHMKRTLFWNTIPAAVERQKSMKQAATVVGCRSVRLRSYQSLFQYSSYDSILLPKEGLPFMAGRRQSFAFEFDGGRVEWMSEDSLRSLRHNHFW